MNILALNGSPRKKWNTAMLLEKTLEGAASQGAETELIHLYDLDYKGCISCFACKTRDGKSYGRCAVKDGLAPVLRKIEEIDALVLGSPIYFGTVSGEMRSFMERLYFPFWMYTDTPQSLFPKKIKTGLIYTMNLAEDEMKERGYVQHLGIGEVVMKILFGHSESLFCCDTYQFDDYSKMVADKFDGDKKAERRRDVFPKDCEAAYEMGVGLVSSD